MTELIEHADELLEDRSKARRFTATLRTLSGVIAEEKVDRIDLLKINAEKSEWHVLQGIEEEDWQKIQQIVLEVDLSEHLPPITALLKKHGYEYMIEQDALLDGTDLCYIYAIRSSAGRRLIRKQAAGEHLLKLPVLSGTSLSAAELRNHLLMRLPEYMIPSFFVIMDSLPLTPNGKLDRKALPVPEAGLANFEESFVAPRTPSEKMLAGIWCHVLGQKKVGIHDNFFELGGHSLLATQVMSHLRKAFEVELPLRSLFEAPTISGLAIRIAQRQAEDANPEEMDRLLTELELSASDTASESEGIVDERYE
jgi:acyl carrier protein